MGIGDHIRNILIPAYANLCLIKYFNQYYNIRGNNINDYDLNPSMFYEGHDLFTSGRKEDAFPNRHPFPKVSRPHDISLIFQGIDINRHLMSVSMD